MNTHSIIGPGKERKKIKIFNSPEEYFNSEEFKEDQRLKELEKNKEQSLDLQITNETILNKLEQLKKSRLYNQVLKRWKNEDSTDTNIEEYYDAYPQLIEVAILSRVDEQVKAIILYQKLIEEFFNKEKKYLHNSIKYSTNVKAEIQYARTELINIIALKPLYQANTAISAYDQLITSQLYDQKNNEFNEEVKNPNSGLEKISTGKTTLTQLLRAIACAMNNSEEGARLYHIIKEKPFFDKKENRYNYSVDSAKNVKKIDGIHTNIELCDIMLKTALFYKRDEVIKQYQDLKATKLYNGKMWHYGLTKDDGIISSINVNNQLLALLTEAMLIYPPKF